MLDKYYYTTYFNVGHERWGNACRDTEIVEGTKYDVVVADLDNDTETHRIQKAIEAVKSGGFVLVTYPVQPGGDWNMALRFGKDAKPVMHLHYFKNGSITESVVRGEGYDHLFNDGREGVAITKLFKY